MEDYNQALPKDLSHENRLQCDFTYWTREIRVNRNDANAYKERASVRNLLTDYQGAIEDYTQAICINPNNDSAYCMRGQERRNLRDYKGAIEDYNKAIELDPNYASAYYLRAELHYQQSNYQGAFEDADRSIQLDPDYPYAYYQRGQARSELGDYEGAIKDYEQAIQLTPSNFCGSYNWAELYSDLGYARANLGDYQGAIKDYNTAIQKDPSRIRYCSTYNNRGNARYNLGDYEGAIEDYSKEISFYKHGYNNAVDYINRGNAYNELRNYQRAIEDYNHAIKIADKYPDVYEYRGLARYQVGDKLGAIEDLEKAADLYQHGGFLEYYQEALNLIQSFNATNKDAIIEDIQEITETVNDSPTEVETTNKSAANPPILNNRIEDTNKENSQGISEKINHNQLAEIKELTAVIEADGFFNPKSIKQARERITISIARRQGQPQFRQSLLEAYNYRCAITGYDAQEALEAAHIIPYNETENNHPSNGLLLRADIHTLFDLNLITINPETMQVRFAPSLRHTSYGEMDGKYLQVPKISSYLPKKDALKWRCDQCEWFVEYK
ncbi:MAG: tetratricopeptide repeat protein [Nostoc sp. DedQUE05]|uniref:tetratricopeptide repeat protein n=1 Tax=Nostoc sp. DedQUE05 TaxID=3075391 RepID=UPI002AD206BE|nr:tetratricopeptide repeat protein [Nostoc sp. DedQUE05]MDZ8091350.1 tetratricopeptide repeat protein [Nostoc sp. DedQUE05]